jgi:hypothetical protein
MRNLLVAGQVALSFMLLIGAGLMIRSFVKLQQVDAGYTKDNILTANVSFNFTKYTNHAQVVNFFDRLTEKMQNTPGILSVAVNTGAPLAPGNPFNQPFIVEGRTVSEHQSPQMADVNAASPDTFKLMGIPLVSGRFFNEHDNADAPQVAIISKSQLLAW